MAPLLEDPRIRQTWNHFSQNAENATESAAVGIWTCLSSIESCYKQCLRQPCFGKPRERTRTRGRAELSFYDWDDELLGGWENDELDRLLAGNGASDSNQQPGRKRGMSYGTRGRKTNLDVDPTIIPSTSALGFLGRLPFKFGETLRYKPSAADLQEHPGSHHTDEESGPLIDNEFSDDGEMGKGHKRKRSSTASSGATSDSFRSRGDLFPSDGEDDAVPISDEFAMALERRTTNSGTDDQSSGKTKKSKGKRASGSMKSRTASRTTQSSQTRPSSGKRIGSGISSLPHFEDETPTMVEMREEEEGMRLQEEAEIEKKRQAAIRLAQERGLQVEDEGLSETKIEPPDVEDIQPPSPPPEVISDQDDEETRNSAVSGTEVASSDFVPARLPNFG